MFPRGASALIMLLLASIVAPDVVGVYALGVLALTLFQSVTDGSVRQIAVKAIQSQEGLGFIRSYRIRVALLGALLMAVFVFMTYYWQPASLKPYTLALLPLLVVPVITAFRVTAIAVLQRDNKWKLLARAQLMAAASSLLISIPILILTRSIWASSFQMVLTEAVFGILVVRWSRHVPEKRLTGGVVGVGSVNREYRHLALYSGLGWGQSQADRVLLAFFAGPVALGLYTLAQSLSRSVGDSLSTSTANVLRPALLKDRISIEEIRLKTAPILRRACHMSGLCTFFVILVSTLLLPLLLPPEWGVALSATGIMALAVGPTMLAWSITVVLIAMNKVKWAAPIKLIGVVMALPIALAAVSDIQSAAVLVVVRDVVLAVLMIFVARGAIDRITLLIFGVWFIALTAFASFVLSV